MNRKINFLLANLLVVLFASLTAVSAAEHLSPTAMVHDGGDNLYVADKTGKQVHKFSLTTQQITHTYVLPFTPEGLTMAPASETLYISGGSYSGVVLGINLTTSQVVNVIPVGHTPMSPILDGNTLYVCNRFSGTVSVIDLNTSSQVVQIATGREPVAQALAGTSLVVANHLPDGPANDNYNVLQVAIIDTASRTVRHQIDLANGSSGARGVCVSPDGAFAYVTHLLGRYQMPTNQLERGWIWTNAISVIDIAAGELINTVLLDDIYAGAANPWAVLCSADGANLCVTHAGSMEVSIIDRVGLHNRLDDVALGIPVPGGFSDSADDVPNDMGFLAGLRKRVQLNGNGPRALALAGNQAWVGNYFSESLDTFDITESSPDVTEYVIGPQNTPSPARLGEQYYNDGNTCYQKWLSCASCHPDGRMDGLNWDLGNDGMGSPRNAKSLLLSHYSAPAMITGIRGDAPTAVNAGFKYIQFMTVDQEKEDAVNAYLASERPVPSPYLAQGNYSEEAKSGRQLFYGTAGCGACHQGDLYIDPSAQDDYIADVKYDVGTGRTEAPTDAERDLLLKDVTTLAEVWRTAPYLQDGRAATMREVLTTYNPSDEHGTTSTLTSGQLDDLEEFVLSIGKSLYTSEAIRADIAGPQGEADGIVNLFDFGLLSYDWLKGTSVMAFSPADITGSKDIPDFRVDMLDLEDIIQHWLFEYEP